MERRNRTNLALGLILILVAVLLVVLRLKPELGEWMNITLTWPMWVVGAGALILIIGLLVGAPGMAIPACIVAGIGGILYYQNATFEWASWTFMWTLIPGFVGIGTILAGLLGQDTRQSLRHGLNLLVLSIVLFLVFASFFGELDILGPYRDFILAGLIMLIGLWLILRGLLRSRRKE